MAIAPRPAGQALPPPAGPLPSHPPPACRPQIPGPHGRRRPVGPRKLLGASPPGRTPSEAWPRACRRALCCQEPPRPPQLQPDPVPPRDRRPTPDRTHWACSGIAVPRRHGDEGPPHSPPAHTPPLGTTPWVGAGRSCSALFIDKQALLPGTPSPGLGPRVRGPGLPAASQSWAPGCWYWGAGHCWRQGEELGLQPHLCRPGSGQSPTHPHRALRRSRQQGREEHQ